MKPIIRIENLSKRYRLGTRASYDTMRDLLANAVNAPFRQRRGLRERKGESILWALRGIDFEVAPGEVCGIIGSNGAGKSTLLKILSRITEPTTGRIELYGRTGSLLEVGTGFHPELSGRENIYLNGAIMGMKRAEIARKFDEIVDFSEISRFIDTPVKFYSSGMYTRLAFAVAAHLEPETLIIDEVLAVGDVSFQKKCLGKMGDVSRAGRTVIFVSHNMAAVRALCSRTIWLDKGQIVASGETGQIVRSYLQQGSAARLEQVWEDPATAPGNEQARLHAARLRPLPPHDSDQISIQSELELEFEFWNYQAGAALGLTIHLYTVDGVYVFAVGSKATPRPAGLVRNTVKIPGNLLNNGVFTITLQIVQDSTTSVYLHPEILVFEVLDSVREVNWFGKWPGVIRPKLEWT